MEKQVYTSAWNNQKKLVQNIWNKNFQDTGYKATKDKNLDRQETNMVSSTMALA